MDFAEFLDQYGLPIAMLIALAVGRFVPGFVYAERKKEVEAANTEIARLNSYVIEEVVPALSRQAGVVAKAIEILGEIQDEKKVQDRVEELQRLQERAQQFPPPSGQGPGTG